MKSKVKYHHKKKENNMTYEVKRNGQKVKGRIIYTNKNLLFESGTEIYESGGVLVEAIFFTIKCLTYKIARL